MCAFSADAKLDSGIISRTLHAILYAHLVRYRLVEAIQLVELVLRIPDPRRVAAVYSMSDERSLASALSIPIKVLTN